MLLWRPSLFWACFTACWAITEQITNYKLPFEVEIFVSEVPVSHSVASKRKQNASKGLHSSVFHFCCGLNTNIYTMATAHWINIDVYWLEKKTRNKEEYQLRLQIVHVQVPNVLDFAVLAKLQLN